MSAKKRERDRAKHEYERHLAWELKLEARRRKRNIVAGCVAAGIVLALIVWFVIANAIGPDPTPQDTTAPVETEQATGTESPAATVEPSADAASAPDPSVAEDRDWTGTMTTSAGDLGFTLDGADAPQAVANFVTLADEGFYDGTSCHRLVASDSMKLIQCGDPNGNGTGGPGYSFGPVENVPADNVYPAGTIAMARVGGDQDSMGSQFFIVYEDTTIVPSDGWGYTVFGQVTSGLDQIKELAASGVEGGGNDGTPVVPLTIEGVTVE